MPQSVMHKAVNKHSIDLRVLRNLPSAIRDPVKIYNSKTSASSAIFLLDLRDAGTQLVAVAEFVKHPDFGLSYMVKSIHHRPADQLERWEAEGLMFYQKEDQTPSAGLSSL